MSEYFSAEYTANPPQHPGHATYGYQQQHAPGYNAYYHNQQQQQSYQQQAYPQQHAYQHQASFVQQQHHHHQQQNQQQHAYQASLEQAYAYGGGGQVQHQQACTWPQHSVGQPPAGLAPQAPIEPQPPLPEGPPPLPPGEQPPLPPEQPGSGYDRPLSAAFGDRHGAGLPQPYPPLPLQPVPEQRHQSYQGHQLQPPPLPPQQQQQSPSLPQPHAHHPQPPQQPPGHYQHQLAQLGPSYLQQPGGGQQYQQQYHQQYQPQHQQQQGYYAGGWAAGSQGYAPPAPAGAPATAYAVPAAPLPPRLAGAPGIAGPPQQPPQQHVPPAAAAAPPLPHERRDVTQLLLPPGRARRPKRLALLLRGLPGSGKSHAARLVRDMETEQGGEAPRILSLDDYFVTEVEKEVEEEEGAGAPAPGGGRRGSKKRRVVTAMEYCYEPEMEAVYRRSLLKAFLRTLEEGRFRFVVLDAPNIRVAEFRDFWAAGQAAGYEVYVLEMPESDPQVCHRRNQHGRSLEDICRLSAEYEPTPAAYACLGAGGLLAPRAPGGGKASSAISDVEMGEEDEEEEEGRRGRSGDEEHAAPAGSRWADLDEDAPAAGARGAKRSRLAPAGAGPDGSSASMERASSGSSVRGADAAGAGAGATSSSSYDGLADGIDELLAAGSAGAGALEARGAAGARRSGSAASGRSSGRGILLSAGAGSGGGRKRVRWPDQMEEDEEGSLGFRIGAVSRQLETVYLVPGLGPPEDGQGHPQTQPRSFAEAVHAEHLTEANAFLSALLGGSRKRPPGWTGSGAPS